MKINANDAREDILAGLIDAELMEKYRVSAKGLQNLFDKLLRVGIVDQAMLDERMYGYDATINVTDRLGPVIVVPAPEEIDAVREKRPAELREREKGGEKEGKQGRRRIGAGEVAADIKAGMGDAELMEKYRLTARGLQSLFEKLLDGGRLSRDEYEERMTLIEGTVDLHEVIEELASARTNVPASERIIEEAHGVTEAYRDFMEEPPAKEEESASFPPDRPEEDDTPGAAWYDDTVLLALTLVFFFPVGFYALIRNGKLRIGTKAAIALGWGILVVGIAAVLLFGETSKVGEIRAAALNARFKGLCRARVERGITETLLIDWTIRTTKAQAREILAAVRAHRKNLYQGGVRYLKYPNETGTYTRIDLKTGETIVTDERAIPYIE